MRLITVLALSFLCTVAFAQKKKKKEVNEDEYPVKTKMILGKYADSILVMHWLKPLAKDMYEGKKLPKGDPETMEILSLASGGDAETRPLYVHLLMYTNWYATEGALADSIGKYNMKLLERFPKDVIRYFKKAETDKRYEDAKKAFLYNIAFEINNQDDPIGTFDEYTEKVLKVYKSKETNPIDDLMKSIRKLMKK
jgi:hypothetical protein